MVGIDAPRTGEELEELDSVQALQVEIADDERGRFFDDQRRDDERRPPSESLTFGESTERLGERAIGRAWGFRGVLLPGRLEYAARGRL